MEQCKRRTEKVIKRGKILFFFGGVVLIVDYTYSIVNLVLYVVTGTETNLYWGIIEAIMTVGLSLFLLNLSKEIRNLERAKFWIQIFDGTLLEGTFSEIDWDKPAGPNAVRVTLAPGTVVHVEDAVTEKQSKEDLS